MTDYRPQHIQVEVSRDFCVSPDRVFSAWLVPRMLGQWMFGPRVREENVVRLDVDPRVGGRYSLKVERASERIEHVGEYLEIDHPRRLAFTWSIVGEPAGAPSVVAIDIVPTAPGCRLTLKHTMDASCAGRAERTRTGWSTMLDALAELPVATRPAQDA